MLKKIFLFSLLALLCISPVTQADAANKAQITNVKVVTRNDADTPFVRTVLEVSSPVKPKVVLDTGGKYVTVSLPYTRIGKNVDTSYKANEHIISRIKLDEQLYTTDVNIKVPQVLSKNDIKVFSLPSDVKNHRPDRVVIDINDKSGKVKTWNHWKEQEDDKNAGFTVPVKPSYKYPAKTTTSNYRVTPGLKGKIICIDPGHGGSDSGALGLKSKEKDITLAISKNLKTLLEQSGAKVIMTRTTDVDVYAPNDGAVEELQARCDIANNADADAFVCIHIDSFSNASATGVTAYYNNKTPYDYTLAKYIHKENMDSTSSPDRGVQTANFYVLLHTSMPATLLELGYISNPNEEKSLNLPDTQEKYAQSIRDGLEAYFANSGK